MHSNNLQFFILKALLLGLVLDTTRAADYCSLSCGSTKNLGCNNSGAWGSSCPSDRAAVTLSSAVKNAIVAKHNEYRNYIAGGKDSKLSAACRMGTMQWNDELAYLASLNVRSCKMEHDACHRTSAFKYSGQNLAWLGWFAPLNITDDSVTSVSMWYAEVKDTQQSHINAYPSNYKGPVIGHFTVMVGERNIAVGCAASTYSVKGQSYKAFLFACNYATTNMVGAKMYSSCSKAASKCTKGTNPSYKNLCSTSEVYDVNNYS